MKTNNRLLLAGTAAALLIAGQSWAQSQMSGPGPIASSPRLRLMLSERPVQVVPVAPENGVTYVSQYQSGTASPKLTQMAENNKKSVVAPGTDVVVTSGNTDKIAASPKLRQQLDDRTVRFEIAPLK